MKRKVLFLCTGNSCRSQMAEAIVNAQLGEKWKAASAGTKPADEFRGVDFDLVVTVCDSAAEECPVWLGKGKRVHHSFPDPARGVGTDAEVMNAFRAVHDDMERKIIKLLDSSDPEGLKDL